MAEMSESKIEVRLSEEDVKKYVAAEIAKALMNSEQLVQQFVNQIMFQQITVKENYNERKTTLFNEAIWTVVKKVIQEELTKACEEKRGAIVKIVRKVFGASFPGEKQFVESMNKQLVEVCSQIQFHVRDRNY
jgi:hypothetical protein